MRTCVACEEEHSSATCCDCGAPALGIGRYACLCAEHGYEAYEDARADAAQDERGAGL
jgi:hypothetical protein